MSQTNSASSKHAIQFGIYTLGDLAKDPHTGEWNTPKQRLKELVEAAKLADDAGIEVFGVGEHHRLDFAVSSPPVVLAAIAQATKQIRLTSATTVLSTADPVRVFEDFAILDLLSDGRAEIISSRGAFLEPFPLFGYKLEQHQEVFEEHIRLLQLLNQKERVTWQGNYRSAIEHSEIAPRPDQEELPLWIGVGGTTATAELAGTCGTGLVLAILKGDPLQYKPLVEAYREAGRQAGHPDERLKAGLTGHGYIADTAEQARTEFYPYYANYKLQFKRPDAAYTPLTKEQFDALAAQDTAFAVGSPEQVAEKIVRMHREFGLTRYMLQMDVGGVPFKKLARAIELLATEVRSLVDHALMNES